MDRTLLELVQQRLADDGNAGSSWARLALAACFSDEALGAALGDVEWSIEAAETVDEPAGPAYIKTLAVEGFRGIGETSKLELRAGDGLTLVVGRNGSGKSSFAEAIELLVTGDNRRWSSKPSVWKEGWRNLHHPEKTGVRADFTFEGPGLVSVSREWAAGDELDDGDVVVQQAGRKKTTLSSLHWTRPLELYRPFLPYSELSGMFDERLTDLHDRLSDMLGLEDLVAAQKALAKVRLDAQHRVDAVREKVPSLISQISHIDDDRARRAVEEVSKKAWDLGAIRALLGTGASGESPEDVAVRQLAELEPIDEELLSRSADELRVAARKLQKVADTASAEALELAELLDAALQFHEGHEPKRCPVCETGALDRSWRTRTAKRVAELRSKAAAAEAAQRQADAALQRLTSLLRRAPACVAKLRGGRVDTAQLADAWELWLTVGGKDLLHNADTLEANGLAVATLLRSRQERARGDISKRADAWARAAPVLATWVDGAEEAATAAKRIQDVRSAETWLKETSGSIRATRFAPIAAKARETWEVLRQQSNVELEELTLEGSGNARRPVMRVEVDGVRTDALSVMSQGELHAIALSLFLPRATMPESPFRFVVVDDPVQSMDPARVDGLARVLASAAGHRQVVVFTHDDRLSEAVRRLGISATILGVTRRDRSQVEVRLEADPVSRALADGWALAKTDELPEQIARRTVPGFCRLAIEAACWEVLRRRRLGRGESHASVDELLSGKTLTTLASLALFDDAEHGGDVVARINRDFGAPSGDAFLASNKGAHQGYAGDLRELVKRTETLASRLRELR